MQSKKTVAIFTTDQGHTSISNTIAKTLEKDFNVHIYSDDNFMFAYYIFIYRFFPSSTKLPFILFHNSILRMLSSISLDMQYRAKVNKFLKKTNPDIVINVFWMFRPSLDIVLKNSEIKYLSIVTDPWTVHPFVASKVAQDNLAFDHTTLKVIKQQVEEAKVTPVGWFVRHAFEEKFNKKEVRQKLKLDNDKLTFLFTTGSEGTEKVLPIIKDVIKTKKPIQLIVACGNNKSMLNKVNTLKDNLKKNITLHAIPFTKELHLYMQAADLVIGKAGPNSVFEAVATHTPFFATTHIAGQEDGNLDIIRELNLGYVEEDVKKASPILLEIIENPIQLESFKESLKKLALYNKNSKKELQRIINL
jgi:UDP-N-acetylglucosamine:LPS N-acetylglucosamine transferase